MISIHVNLIFLVCLAAWIGFRILANHKAGMFWAREIVLNLFFLYGWGIFFLTLAPLNIVLYDFDFRGANLVPVVETLHFLRNLDAPGVKRNLLGNVLLLAPLGIFLPILFRRYRRLGAILVTGLMVTVGIETMQLLLAYRVFDIDDLILNLSGVLLAFGFLSLLLAFPGIRRAIDRITNRPQVGTGSHYRLFVVITILTFGFFFTTGYLQSTHTETQLIEEIQKSGQEWIASAGYGHYLFILAAAANEPDYLRVYRQAPFNRFAQLNEQEVPALQPNEFFVTGYWVMRDYADALVIVKTERSASVMKSADEQFPVALSGGYLFAVGRFPLDTITWNRDFRFFDDTGTELPLVLVDQN